MPALILLAHRGACLRGAHQCNGLALTGEQAQRRGPLSKARTPDPSETAPVLVLYGSLERVNITKPAPAAFLLGRFRVSERAMRSTASAEPKKERGGGGPHIMTPDHPVFCSPAATPETVHRIR